MSNPKLNSQPWQQGELVNITIEDLNHDGEGVGRCGGQVVFVPDTAIGDRIVARLVRIKSNYAQGKLQEIIVPSPQRRDPRCFVADKCGGCQWQHIDYESQLQSKRNLVIQALQRLAGIAQPPVAPVLRSPNDLGYRNKVTYPLARSATGSVQAGYYRRGTHQLINLNQCPVQDPRLHPFLAQIKGDLEKRGWSIYNEQRHQGKLRHLALRIGRNTGEILLTLVSCDWHLPGIEEQAEIWLQRYPQLVGVCLNHNPQRSNAIWGAQTRSIAGQIYLEEHFAGLTFQLRPETFFQVNTEAAEALLEAIIPQLNLQGREILLDAYCGIGTFTLPLATKVRQGIAIEVQSAAVKQARINAKLNGINNVTFQTGAVEELMPQLQVIPDLVVLDPPRKGCPHQVISTIKAMRPSQLIYVSCKPATLARDIKILCQDNCYELISVQPADFFPQTSHVECAALLKFQPH